MDRGHCMSGQHPFRNARFDSSPGCRTGLCIRFPVEQNIEDYIDIEQDSGHRYFAAICFRYESISAFLRDPRIDRRIGASRVIGEGGAATAARYASTISDPETPRRCAERFARDTTRLSTLKVSFDIYVLYQ